MKLSSHAAYSLESPLKFLNLIPDALEAIVDTGDHVGELHTYSTFISSSLSFIYLPFKHPGPITIVRVSFLNGRVM